MKGYSSAAGLCLVMLAGALAAPRGRPLPPEFEVLTVGGRWDGDACHQPWLLADDGGTWVLAFPDRGTERVLLGPLDSTVHVRATGYTAVSGRTRLMYVTRLTAAE